jgi:hypothetical protein
MEVAYGPPNCTSMLQPLDLGIIQCFKQFYKTYLVRKVVYFMDSGKGSFQVIYFTAAWRQVTASTTVSVSLAMGMNIT